METLVDLFTAGRRLVDLVESRDDVGGSGLVELHLALLELLRLATSELEGSEVPASLAPTGRARKRSDLAPRFRELGFYWVVLEPLDFRGKPRFGVGDALDDLLDTYTDVHGALKLLEAEGLDEALWKLRFDFRTHWGEHAHQLAAHLHRLRARSGR